jgi:hypothetical protein
MTTILEPDLARDPAPESSERSFGLLFAAVFGLLACWPLLHMAAPRWWAFGGAAAFALAALVRPTLLRPLNRAWLLLARLLHRVTSPLVMGAIFFLCVTPIGWIMRLLRKDVLSLARRGDLASYWIECAPTPPESMKNQF